VLILATSEAESLREYARVADHLPGWRVRSIDLPAHGADRRAHERKPLTAWRQRLDQGDDLIGDFQSRLSRLIDDLPPGPVAVIGVSRGGFLALHAAARDPRIRAVVAFMPVTALHALTEFADTTHYDALDVAHLATALSDRPVWISISHDDPRVSTPVVLAAADAVRATFLVEAARGHHYSVAAEQAAATWLRNTMR